MSKKLSLPLWILFIWTVIGTVLFSGVHAMAATPISSNITTDTTWNVAGSPYVINADITVVNGVTLTIEAGSVIEFSWIYDLLVEGSLVVQGTEGSPVVFTASTPAPGNWGYIEIPAGGSANINYADIRYGGGGASPYMQVLVNGGDLTMTNSVIQESLSFGQGVRIQDSDPVLTNNTFSNSGVAMSMDLGSDPLISGVIFTNNGVNGLQVDGGTLVEDGFWDDPDIVYVTKGDITVPAGMTLTVGQGQVVKVGNYNYDIFINGILDATGTVSEPIVFTSLLDDMAGGDTNNNGATAPATANWGRIEVGPGASATMEYVDIRYGGGSGSPVTQLYVNQGDLTLGNSSTQYSHGYGIRILGSDPVLENNTYSNNNGAAVSMDVNSEPAVSGATITANGTNGLEIDGGTLTGDRYWDDSDIVYVTKGDITVPVGRTLTIGPGLIIKFGSFQYDLFVDGILEAYGTFAAPIVFTELRDDTVGGDTNNGGGTPVPGGWGTVRMTGSGNYMEHVNLRWGGYAFPGQVTMEGGDLTMVNCEIRRSYSDGLWAGNSSRVTVASSLLHHNTYGDRAGIGVESGALVTAINNTIDGNYRGIEVSQAHAVLTNNLVTNSIIDGIYSGRSTVIELDHNNVFNPAGVDYKNLTDQTGQNGNIAADPLYTDPDTYDYQLQAGSPAIDSATSQGAPPDDFLFSYRVDDPGTTPNTGAGIPDYYDMGAIEYGGIPGIVKHRPVGDTRGPVESIRFTFRSRMDTTSYAPGDDLVSFSGPHGSITPSGFFWRNPYMLEVACNTQYGVGDYQLVIGPDILDESAIPMDTNGNGTPGEIPDDQYTANFAVTPPQLLSHSPPGVVNGPIDTLQFFFDRPMDQTSFAIYEDIVSFTGPEGEIVATDYNWTDPQTLEVVFDPQSMLGAYRMVLDPGIADAGGNPIDQDQDYVYGEIPDDQYTADFTLADIYHVSGALTANATWQGITVVDDDVTVNNGVTLTIEPGTIVKFDNFEGNSITVPNGGTLVAEGTTAQPINFTSLLDDTTGGDTNNDGNGTLPALGDWLGIHVLGGQASLDHVIISYGGGTINGVWSTTAGAVVVQSGGSVTLSNSRIRDVLFEGILAWGSGTVSASNTIITGANRAVNSDDMAVVSLTNCTLDNNLTGIWGHGGDMIITNTIISNSVLFGIDNVLGSPISISYSNIWSTEGTNYQWLDDQTGLNGNLSVNPRYRDTTGSSFQLDYLSPMIDAAEGTLAPVTDYIGAPRYDDPRSPNTGVVTPGGEFADIGALEFVETAASDIDLVITTVYGPDIGIAGQEATVEWRGENIGTAYAEGAWHDAVYLSGDTVWSTDDILLGSFLHTGEVGPGQSYENAADVTLPGVPPGGYYFIVRANSAHEVFEGQNLANNSTASYGTIGMSLPTLELGVPEAGQLPATGSAMYYRLAVPENKNLKVTLDGANGAVNELYVKFGDVPSRQSFDVRGARPGLADQSVSLANIWGGDYFVMVYGADLPGPEDYTITAFLAGFAIDTVNPATGSNTGQVTVLVDGSQFDANSDVRLIDSNDQAAVPLAVKFIDTGRLAATFDLTGLPTGLSDIRVINTGNVTTTLTDGFEIIAGIPGRLETNLISPARVRYGRNYIAYIEYTNTGGTDLVAPTLMLSSASGLSTFSLSPDHSGATPNLRILATSPGGLPGILSPGASGRVTVYGYAGALDSETLQLFIEHYDGAIDWNALEATMRPDGVPDETWDQLYGQLISQIGDQWSDFLGVLAENAALIPSQIGLPTSVDDVFSLELDKVVANLSTSVSGRLYLNDLEHPLANVEVVMYDEAGGNAASAVSLNDGSILFSEVADGSYDILTLGYTQQTPQQIVVDGSDVDNVEIILTRGGAMAGRALVEGSGAPVPEALIMAVSDAGEFYETLTDSDGMFSLPQMVPGTYTVYSSSDQTSWVSFPNIDVIVGQTVNNINPVMDSATTVSGTVRHSGTPVSDALVSASADEFFTGVSATTGPDGQYTLEGVAPGTYTISAVKDGYSPAQVTDLPVTAAGATGIDFDLAEAGTISGTLTAAGSGVGLPYAYIFFKDGEMVVDIILTDPDGSFSGSQFASGTYDYHILAKGFLETTGQVAVTAGQNTILSLALDPAGTISGEVTDGTAAGVSGLRIELHQAGDVYDYTATDDTGYYDFINLPLGDYEVILAANDWGSVLQQHALTVSSGSEDVTQDMTFALQAGIKGTIVEADNTTPIGNVKVTLFKDGKPITSTVTSGEGSYAFNILQAGDYTVAASGGLSIQTADVSLSIGEFVTDLKLARGAESMQVEVLDLSGLPIQGASVTLITHSSMTSANDIYDIQDMLLLGSTDYDGLASGDGLVPGDYVMVVTASGNEIFHRNITINQGVPNETSVTMEPGIEITGSVERPGGETVSGAVLTVLGSDPAGNLAGSFQIGGSATDDLGDFVIPDLPADQDITVRVTDGLSIAEFALSPEELFVPEGLSIEEFALSPQDLPLNLVLPDYFPAGVGGRVLNDGVPLVGAEIILLDANGLGLDYLVADENGVFESHLVLPGENVKVIVESEGFEPFSEVVFVLDNLHFVDMGDVTLDPVAATDDNIVPSRDPGGGPSSEENRVVDPVDNLPPVPPPPIWPDFEKCSELFEKANLLNEILLKLDDARKYARQSNSVQNNLAEAGLVFFQANSLASSVLSVLNPAQGAIDAITFDREKILAEISRGNSVNRKKYEDNLKAISELLTTDLIGLYNEGSSLLEHIQSRSGEYTAEQFHNDVNMFMGIVNSSLGIIEKIFGHKKELENLGAIMGPLSKVWDVVNAVKDAWDLGVELATAAKNIRDRRDALSNADFAYKRALDKLDEADAKLKECDEGLGPYGGSIDTPDAPDKSENDRKDQKTEKPKDPNDKSGAAGYGAGGYIQPGTIPYLVQFENDPDAGATVPAQEVFVTDSLDDDLDLTTLEFTGFGFNNFDFSVPPGLSHYETVIDQRPHGINLLVTVVLDLNMTSRELSATFRSLDPLTGQLPDDVDAGFLPVNDKELHNGEGYITFIVRPNSGLVSGTQITNQASIVFDVNAPILTPEAINTIDVDRPTSSVSSLPATSPAAFTVQWSGSDGSGSGVALYGVYAQDNGGAFKLWQPNTTATSALFNGVPGHTYGFYSIATDNTGQMEAAKTVAEAVTQIEFTMCDINGNNTVELDDAILVLQVLAGLDPASPVLNVYDINGDNRVGIEEVICVLQIMSELR